MQPGDLAHFWCITHTAFLYTHIPEDGYFKNTARVTLKKDANGAPVVYLGDVWTASGRFYKVLYRGTVGVIHNEYVWRMNLHDDDGKELIK